MARKAASVQSIQSRIWSNYTN